MKRHAISLALVLMVATPAVAAEPTDAPRPGPRPAPRMTLAQCLDAATAAHPDLADARLATRQQEAEADKASAALLPRLSVSASVQVWDDAATAELFAGGSGSATVPVAESDFDGWVLQQLGAFSSLGSEPMTLREQVTGDVTVQVVQPLTVGAIVQGGRAASALADAARAHERTAGQDRALAVATAYFNALQAETYLDIADAAVSQLEAHKATVDRFVEEHIMARNDVLKVEVELARARQTRIKAVSGVNLSRAALAVEIGRDSSAPVAPAPLASEGPAVAIDPEAPLNRPELDELEAQIRAAEHGASASWWQVAPTVALVGRYSHSEGQGRLAIKDSAFVGLTLEWDLWDWGQRYDAARSAELAAERAAKRGRQAERLLRLQVVDRREALDSAQQALGVAAVAVEQAEEALRIEEARLGEDVATATDVLDAQAAVTRARVDHANARYAALMAAESLRHALGLPVAGQGQ
ncbi:MAG: TolC family protein [Deltaproteobacteria bacterium]|nr:MAG: TolC family protein [Deltaproteobacteria bacterium]